MRGEAAMARVDTSASPDTLFPYLSVLLSIIGVLFLGLVIISTGQLELKRKIARNQGMWKEYDALRQQRLRAAEAARLAEALRDAEKARGQELERLRQQVENLERTRNGVTRLAARQDQDVELASRLEAAIVEKRRQYADLAKLRDEKQLAIRSAPRPGTVRIVGTARYSGQEGGADKPEEAPKPVFFECRGDNVILQPEGVAVASNQLARSTAFEDRVARAEKERDRGALLVLLVRSDGVKAFDRANAILKQRKARYGFLPIPGSDDVDLSAFR